MKDSTKWLTMLYITILFIIIAGGEWGYASGLKKQLREQTVKMDELDREYNNLTYELDTANYHAMQYKRKCGGK